MECLLSDGGMVAASMGIMAIEYALGRTDLVKPNSMLELLMSGILKVFKKPELK